MKTWIAPTLLVLAGTAARADEYYDHVYRIVARAEGKAAVELSGFRVKGRDGLYTALHGVVGRDKIVAFQPSSQKVPERYELRVAEVDIDRDVAYLVTKGGPKLPKGGLSLGVAPKAEDLVETKVRVLGFPLGVDLLASSTPLTIRRPAVTALDKLANPKARAALLKRNSPATESAMISLDGNLLPGHSGAPILDGDGAVIGIGNGGLERGAVGWGWAVPFHDVKLARLSDAASKDRLEALGKADNAFAHFCVIDEDSRKQGKALKIETVSVIAGKDGKGASGATVTPKQGIGALMKHLEETLKAAGNGKGDKVNPMDALKLVKAQHVPLAEGTKVAVLEVEEGKGGDAGFFPAELFEMKDKGLKGAFDAFGAVVANAAEGVNVKVKVLEGAHKGKTLWVYRTYIKRETVLSETK